MAEEKQERAKFPFKVFGLKHHYKRFKEVDKLEFQNLIKMVQENGMLEIMACLGSTFSGTWIWSPETSILMSTAGIVGWFWFVVYRKNRLFNIETNKSCLANLLE